MKPKAVVKRIIDMFMLFMLPVLMSEILTGQQAHEWLGTSMVLLFLLHHVLNFGWMRNLFQGNYTPFRCAGTAFNVLLLFDFFALAFSGIMMSGFVFTWLPFSGGMITARTLHLFSSHWGLILMSLHTGMHWKLVLGMCKNRMPERKIDDLFLWLLRGAAFSIVLFGIYAFMQQKMTDYLFMRTHFVFFDETKPVWMFYVEVTAMIGMFIAAGHYLGLILQKWRCGKMGKRVAKILAFCIPVVVIAAVIFSLNHGNRNPGDTWSTDAPSTEEGVEDQAPSQGETTQTQTEKPAQLTEVEDGFVFISGGTFEMGSPEDEAWRSDDETLHTVTISDFYISPYELTQKEYQEIMGENPSNFKGDELPVENISWLDAVAYCNARSEREGLTPAYTIDGGNVSWNRAADGYRLPTEAEWEYACRAGTETPFNTETSIGADEANYYGHYPYMIEDNYFSQGNLDTKPGEYRQTTVEVDSFSPNGYGLYNMHGNVSEWVWDTYGSYGAEGEADPTGAASGSRKVYRGGGWNDFAKNMRSAYRATLEADAASFNLGLRLVRGAVSGNDDVISSNQTQAQTESSGKILIAYFSWGGNTRGVAEEIQAQTGADLFEITCVEPYSSDYNTVLEEAQRDQNVQARPELAEHVENMDEYDIVMIGYPNWWASIPMPIASFLEEYDFSDKIILPFCSHGGGRFGQSLTAIAKLAPDAEIGEGLSIHYSGGSELPGDVTEWLKENNIIQ